jgi:hypothetical protein
MEICTDSSRFVAREMTDEMKLKSIRVEGGCKCRDEYRAQYGRTDSAQ